jgi:hypothetical protein
MTTASKRTGGILIFTETLNAETILPMAPVLFEDDFLGAAANAFPTVATAGTAWGKKLVQTAGAPSVGGVANGPGGQAKIALDATSEDQEAVLYFLDNLYLDTAAIAGCEFRFSCPTIPNGGVQAVLGLASTYNAGPDNNACYVRACLRGNGAILVETFDGTTRNSAATGITIATPTEWHSVRAEMLPGQVAFWLDGFNALTLSYAPPEPLADLQPYFSLYKSAGTGSGVLAVDYVRMWGNRGGQYW